MQFNNIKNNDFIQIINRLQEHQVMIDFLKNSKYLTLILRIKNIIVETFKNGNKLLICGNGGSASNSQHIPAEFIGKFYIERKALDAEALTVNTPYLHI